MRAQSLSAGQTPANSNQKAMAMKGSPNRPSHQAAARHWGAEMLSMAGMRAAREVQKKIHRLARAGG